MAGKVTATKMYHLGIFTGKDLKSKSETFLETHFGKSGLYYYNVVRGIHNSPVKPNRIRKSLAAEQTFATNLTSELFMLERLRDLSKEVSERLKKQNVSGKPLL